ncbi:hypothetical protein [Paucihalobacter sp.]|uniref:hypothetical protein n=1 Tax=Paucihalobacter sp. TaxID=2850405 RepID=UPI003D160FF7
MYNTLLLKAFEKAGEDIHAASTSKRALHLSDVILEYSGMPYGERSLRDKHKEVQNGQTINLSLFVADALSNYLGFENFSAYVASNESVLKIKKSVNPSFFRRYRLPLLLISVLLIILTIDYTTKTRWMVWEADHYIEVGFDEKLLQTGSLKIYNKDRIEHFKKVEVNCESSLSVNGGAMDLWYGKNKNGELELFTTPGLHPETGKTLKALTKYMFDKYICPN